MMNLSILIFIAIISTCLSVALADVQSNNTNVILNHILTTTNNNDNNAIAQQQLVCNNETSIQIYGMTPNKGSELGNTPVALAVQIDSNNDDVDDIREKLNCNFGSSIQTLLINGDEMNDQLARIAFATLDNSGYANNTTQLGSKYELLLCKSPAATSIGHIPFHISCNQVEEQQTSSSIESSTLQFEYTIATLVHTIHPPLGTPNYTTVTITGSGYSNGTYLSCFFGRNHVVLATYISSEEVQCDVPSSLPLSEEEERDEYPIFISNNGIDYEGEHWSTVSFIAVPLPVVQSVESNTFTWSTNSNVTVIGQYFNPHSSSKAVCSFDFGNGDNTQLTSVGVVVNDAQIKCPLPVLQEELVQRSPFIGNIRISTNDGIDYSTSSSSIFIYGPLLLQSVHPKSASLESGGTNITLYGSNFHPSNELSCLFTSINDYVITIPAIYDSSSKVECQTPQAMMAGVAQLSVSTSNQIESNSVDFTFVSLPTLVSATPLTSSSWSGGTIVTIQGSGFNNDDSLGSSTYCQFGNTLVVANVLNSNTLTCITPPVTLVRHDVSSYEALDSLLDGIEVTLEVSINGHVTNSGITFQYFDSTKPTLSTDNAISERDEVDTLDHHPTNVQVTSFSPTYGSEEGGTIIHLVGTGFNEELSSPQCVFFGGETTVATVISHTLVKCIAPAPSLGQVNTSVGLSFNGDDLVLADTKFSYVSAPIINNVSPKYISSNGGSKLTISGTNLILEEHLVILEEHLVGVWKCSFGDTVVAASTTSEGDIVCFAPPIQPGVVEVRVSINGVDFTTQSVKVISHLPAEIYNYVLQDDDDTVVVNGINFQPSPDMSCIFNVQDVRITEVATWESDTQVTCSIPPIVVGATSTTLEISITNEHHPDNPSVSFYCPQRDESLPSNTLEELTYEESKTENMNTNKYSTSIDSVEPTAISEVGCDELTIHIVSDLQLGAADLSCAFTDSAGRTRSSPVSAVVSKYNADDGKRSTLVTCPTPEMVPGAYLLSLKGINEKMASDDITTVTVYPESSALEETSQPFDISSSNNNNTDIRKLDELDTLSIDIHPSFGPESGGNAVIISGSGFKLNSSISCRFGEDSVSHAKFISGESLECIAPPVVNHPVVNVSLTIDGVEWASSSSQTYTYLPMIRINEISPSSLQIDVPHKVIITGDNFEYMPFQLMCKLGTTILSNTTTVDESSVTCFIPPIYQPGEVTLDLVIEEDGTSMLEPNSSNNTIKFHIPIDYSIFPSFADMTGGTNVIITNNNLAKDVSKQLICRFNLNNDTSIDVIATQLSDTRHSCLTPNVYDWSADTSANDHPIHATLSVVSSEESQTSIPFMFKTTPIIESIFPSTGSVNGNTLVRVRSSSSMWVNSTLLTCLFGEQEVRAIFVSARTVDCVSPPGNGTEAVRVSDNNNINLPESNQIYYTFHDEPYVSLVTPSFGLASDNNVIKLIGSGFAEMESSCMLQDISSGSTHQVKGSFINKTVMECYIGSDVLPPSQYVCRASNNGGIEYGGFNTTIPVHYTLLAAPSIISINPSSGISEEPINVTILGTDLLLVGSSSSQSHCVLLDHDGLQVSSSLANVLSEELIRCLVHCPSGNSTTKYSLGISLGGSDQVYSTSSFWCEPRARILAVSPKYISVGESTPIGINLEEFRPSSPSSLACVFGSGHEIMPATSTANGVVECPSPAFNYPHDSMALSLSADNLTITETVEIDVVDPISISRIDPLILFGGSNIIIEGNNFMPDGMICTLGDSIGEVATSNDTHVVCRSPTDLVSSSAEVILSINGAPQLNASAGYVDVLPPPRVDKVTPSSSLALGGTNVIIYGANFYDISNPVCYFDDAKVKAYVLTDKTMSCKTSDMNDLGEVSVHISLDDGRSRQGGDVSFSFLSPITLHDVYPQVVVNGTQIRLVGEGFTSPILCAFGDSMFTPATVLSSKKIMCTFSSNNEDFGQLSVSIVSVDYIPLSIGNQIIKYHPQVEIYSSSHLYGTVMGADLVESQVYGILDDIITEEEGLGLVHCQFGDKFTLASLELDESIVHCLTPAADSPGNVSVSLTYAGLPFSSNSLAFEYTTQPKIVSIHPTSGPLAGGTSVRIQGLNLQSISSCMFGNELAYGYMDSENTIVCISPATNSASRHAVSLLLDSSKELLDTGLDFHYIEPFTLESVYPLSIDRGVEFIRVNGRGYSRLIDLQCCFGGESDCILSEAIVSTNTTLKCPLPSWGVIQEIGPTIPLSVTSNGVDFVQSPTPLTYQGGDMIIVKKLSPIAGPSFGGTVVDVYGLGFQEYTSYSCWFGKVSSRWAEYISDGHIQCTTPTSFVKESEQVATVSFSLTPHPLDSSLNFTFYSQPTRLEMYPTHTSGGGTEAKIGSSQLSQVLSKMESLGIPLDPTCQFNATVVPASIYKGDYIICTSPPIETTTLQNLTTTTPAVQVSVSLNGQDYISINEQYHYYQPISINSVAPDILWVDDEAIELVIRGSNFLPLNQASCIVGEELIQADVVSSSEVRCLVQNLNHSDQVVPVSVSLNGGVDSSNVLPLSCRVNTPLILSANPLFVAEAPGGTTVELKGTGFDQMKDRALIKLNDALVPLSVIDNTTASFDAPSGRGTHTIRISYHESTFVDTGFELQYLPPLHISAVKPAFVVLDTVNRVTISGSFGGEWNYKCVLSFDDDDSVLAYIPNYVNETSMSCDIDLVGASAHHSSTLRLAVHREEDNQTSNALNIYTTPRYAIESVDPSVLSEAQANAGGQLLAIQALQEMEVTAEPILCKFTDSIGIISMTSVDIISAHESRCTIPPLTGDAQVCLTREEGTVQSNSIELAVYPTCELVKLIPSSGPLSGGTNVTVQGIGFSAYSDVDILCQFGNEISAAHIMDDEHIHCKTPSSKNKNVTFSLAQANQYGNIPISNTDLTFQYYSSPKIITITPDSGPASGGHEINLHIEGLNYIGSSLTLSFTSVADQSYVTYTKDIKVLNQSTLQVMTPPSPSRSDGGMVVIRISGNGQDFSTDGVYYNHTESSVLRSFYPSEVVEGSCFNLTILVDNLYTSPSHCVIDGGNYPASNGEVAGAVNCNNACLDVHEGPYQVGLLLDNDVFLPASNDIQVRRRINANEMIPFMGSTEGGTLVIIWGEFQEWSSQLYCFFGEHSTLATAINDTAVQCIAPPISMLKEDLLEKGVKVYVAPSFHHQSMTRDSFNSSMVFIYYEKEVIESITPRSGSEEGGTAIQVYGSGFINTTSLTCKFGEEVEIQAVFLSNEHIMCTSPPLLDVVASLSLPVSVPLMVSNNNKDYVSAGSFVYHDTPQIIRLSPAIGPAQTSVRLHSKSSLGWVEHLVCRFGGIVATNATVVSDYEVECVSPPTHVLHLGDSPSVEVEISLNGIDFFTSGHSFQYTNQPLIYSMSPVYGPITGGNAIVLHGKSLVFSQDNLVCHFGESQTISLSVSESTITCIAPASTKHGIIPFGIVTKDTNVVLEQYHDDTVIQYTYLPPVFVSSLYPSFGSMNGGTLLSIETKEEVPNVDELYCVFGGSTTTIALIDRTNRTLVTCLTPHSSTSGSISVGLAQDQGAEPTLLTTSDVQFRYTIDPTINGLHPRRGSSNSETNITLKGSSFSQGSIDSVVCKVGSHELPATFLSDDEIKCTAPPDIPIREIQAVTILGSSEDESSRGSFTLGFKGEVSDPINIDSSVDEIRERLLALSGLEDISVSLEDTLDKTYLVTFLGMVKQHHPPLIVEQTTVDVHIDRRQSLCCNVSLSLNGGVDFYDTDLVFVYHDKVVVTGITPDHGSVSGGTNVELSMLGISRSKEDAMCIFGSIEVQGTWVNEEIISCVSPASLDDTTVAVGVKFSGESGARAESMVTFTYHFEPEILSIFPLSLPALHASKVLDVYGMHFYESESMTCVYNVSLPSDGGGVSLEDRLATYRESATFHNSSHIQCPNPPELQSFFSITDQSWASNSTLVEGSILSISLESGADSYYIGTIPFHVLVETTSLFPETGPRNGGTEVIVEGINMMNTTHLTCRFGSVVGQLAQYISPTKVLCITPHYPNGYGRALVPIQVALNGVDFSSVADDAMFEYHEPIVFQVDPMASLPMGGSIINVALDDESMGFSALHENSPDMMLVSHLDPPYGPASGGNVVTIVGQGFTANHATTCSFCGVTITASFVSEESLSCVAPQSEGDNVLVDVVISVDGDELIGGQQQYVYLPIKL